jgi:hypothetical protein
MNFNQRLADEKQRHQKAVASLVEAYINENAIYPVGMEFLYQGDTCIVKGRSLGFDPVEDPDREIDPDIDVIYSIDDPQWKNAIGYVTWPQRALKQVVGE